MLWMLYAISVTTLFWIYDGYGRFLRIVVAVRNIRNSQKQTGNLVPSSNDRMLPAVTVLLTVHNEQDVVERRVQNILACRYPSDRLDVVVASDGSTDNTNSLVQKFNSHRVRLIETAGLGKTATQNEALKQVTSDVVVFTDADTKFSRDFIAEITTPFEDTDVGAVDGRLLYGDRPADGLIQGQGFYWNYELGVRNCESQLGLLAVLTGASFAVRRELIRPMDASIGEDCIVPLDVVLQQYRVVHQPTAEAYDSFETGTGVTFRRRIRMTLRNWQGTWSRSTLLNPFTNPRYAFALWSHKVLRWLSPVFLLTATVCAVANVVVNPGLLTGMAVLPFVGLFGVSVVATVADRFEKRIPFGRRIPFGETASGFLLANAAFLVGVIKAVCGQRIRSYQTVVENISTSHDVSNQTEIAVNANAA